MTSESDQAAARVPELLLVTGMSGAGKSTAVRALEDIGWFVIDNLPSSLLAEAVAAKTELGRFTGLAVVVDARAGDRFHDLRESLRRLEGSGVDVRTVFLEAADEAIVRRFESSRRPHPLQGTGRILDGIARERRMLGDFRGEADLVIDTTTMNVHDLRRRIESDFPDDSAVGIRATVLSFGFKYGIPADADVVFDARFLPNPYWVPELREHTGLDADVNDYVVGQPAAPAFLDRVTGLVQLMSDGYLREGKRYVTVAIGCTGGKHRSVAIAENLGVRLVMHDVETLVSHRDLGRE